MLDNVNNFVPDDKITKRTTDCNQSSDINYILSFINPDCSHQEWLWIGTVLKAGNFDFNTFDNWSRGGSSYNKKSAIELWRSIKQSGIDMVRKPIGALIKEAKKYGYTQNRTIKAPPVRHKLANNQAEIKKAQRAAQKARRLFDAAKPVNKNPYLIRKGVNAAGNIRQIDASKVKSIIGYYPTAGKDKPLTGQLMVFPVSNQTGITSCQLIDSNGLKHVIAGSKKAGCYWSVKPIGKQVLIAEGLATALSGYQATGINAVVAMDDHGVLKVAQAIRKQYPETQITILGELKQGLINNYHRQACQAVRARLAVPLTGGTDFNDLHIESGLEAVRQSINESFTDTAIRRTSEGKPIHVIDIDAAITVDNRSMSVFDAVTQHGGQRKKAEINGQNYWINDYGFHSCGKNKGHYFQIGLLDIPDYKFPEKMSLPKKIALADNKPDRIFSIVNSILYKFETRLGNPINWIQSNFDLHDYHLNRISRLVQIRINEKKHRAKSRYKLNLSAGQNIHLKRVNSMVDWDQVKSAKPKRLVVFQLEHGSGKTETGLNHFMQQAYDGKTNLTINNLQSLTEQNAQKTDSHHYRESELLRSCIGGLPRLACCLPSIAKKEVKQNTRNTGVFCIDEIEQVIGAYLNDEIFKEHGKPQTFSEFIRLLIRSDQIVVADADVTESTVQWLCNVIGIDRHKDVMIVTGDQKPKNYKTMIDYGYQCHLKAKRAEIKNCIRSGGRPVIAVSSKKVGRKLHEEIQAEIPAVYGEFHANEKGGYDYQTAALMENPASHTLKLDYLIFTSKINTGVSIVHDKPHFTEFFGLFDTATLSPNIVFQSTRRIRYLEKFNLFFYANIGAAKFARKKKLPNADLNSLVDWLEHRQYGDQAYFVQQVEYLLDKYGFNPVFKTDSDRVGSKTESFTLEDTETILAAAPILKEHRAVNSNQQRFENGRFDCCRIFKTQDLNADIVRAFITDKFTAIRFNQLTDDSQDDQPNNQHNLKAYQTARELFSLMLISKIRPQACSEIMTVVRSHEAELRRAGLLPDWWTKTGIPKKNGAGAVAHLAVHWGLFAEVVQYAGGKNRSNQVSISLNPVYETIAAPQIKPVNDQGKQKASQQQQAIVLKQVGKSRREIMQALNLSESTVKRYLRNC